MRQFSILLATACLLLAGVLHVALPVSASPMRSIDPTQLALPQSALPAGAVIDHSGVSDNADADGTTTPPDGIKAQTSVVHSQLYEVLGRITGYRMDFHWPLGGAQVGTEYQASLYADDAHAAAAIQDATKHLAVLLPLLGGKPLPETCTAGVSCTAYEGPNPLEPGNEVVFAMFQQGPVVVETANQVPTSAFAALEPQLASALFAFLAAANTQILTALNGTTTTQPTTAPTTAPTAAPTAVPTATSIPKKKKSAKCKKGYKRSHGKCVRRKKHA